MQCSPGLPWVCAGVWEPCQAAGTNAGRCCQQQQRCAQAQTMPLTHDASCCMLAALLYTMRRAALAKQLCPGTWYSAPRSLCMGARRRHINQRAIEQLQDQDPLAPNSTRRAASRTKAEQQGVQAVLAGLTIILLLGVLMWKAYGHFLFPSAST